MQHFVCTGDCAGESDQAKVCDSEGCSKEGQPLVECDCDDGLHKGVTSNPETDDLDMESMDDEDDM